MKGCVYLLKNYEMIYGLNVCDSIDIISLIINLFVGIDLQSCGLTSISGKAFLDILQSNNTLMVIDLRDNKQIGM